MNTREMWAYREPARLGFDPLPGRGDLTGYDVEALDGAIGTIAAASYDVGQSYVIVDTGPWISGKRVMLPARVLERVDELDEKVWVDTTKDEIENAPEHDELVDDPGYRDEIGSYYGVRPAWRRRRRVF